MAQSGTFRTALFGGYNRDDVEEYIQNMEHEIETVKLLHRKEKLELMRRVEESEGELSAARLELEAARSHLENTDSQAEEPGPDSLDAPEGESAADSAPSDAEESAAEEREAFNMLQEDLLKEEKRDDEEKEAFARLKEAYDSLEKENQELKERLADRDDLFDYDTVIKIMEEARTNADLIEKEAKERADKMLEEAKSRAMEEEERQRRKIASRVNAQLEEKGIQLMAAKYKIEQYIKRISDTQQGLYLLNERMEKMVEDMPVRLDDYWEGEEFRQLEDKEKRGEIPHRLPGTEQ